MFHLCIVTIFFTLLRTRKKVNLVNKKKKKNNFESHKNAKETFKDAIKLNVAHRPSQMRQLNFRHVFFLFVLFLINKTSFIAQRKIIPFINKLKTL